MVRAVLAKPMMASAMATGAPPGKRQMREHATPYQPDECGEEQQVGNEHGDDRHADEHVVRAADRGAGLAKDGDEDAGKTVDGDGDPWRSVARMDVAEGGREIAVDAGDKRQPRGGGEIAGCSADALRATSSGEERSEPWDAETSAEVFRCRA